MRAAVQLRHSTRLSELQYVIRQGWLDASLSVCPNHPQGGCLFHRHGHYVRKSRHGAVRIVRYYCRTSRTTFSLLPDCLAARLPGTLSQLEAVVSSMQSGASPLQAARAAREVYPVEAHGMRAWARRRQALVEHCLAVVITMFPMRFSGCPPRVVAVRRRLSGEPALAALRRLCDSQLQSVPAPVGFLPP